MQLPEPARPARARVMPCRNDGGDRPEATSRLVPELLRLPGLARPLTMRFAALPVLALFVAMLAAPPAAADGGAGSAGDMPFGSVGGVDSTTGAGGNGQGGGTVGRLGGGGGGGAGASGGSGGSGRTNGGFIGVAGGAGGAAPGQDGSDGGADDGGGGGGGGAHGYVGSLLPTSSVVGGSGGAGGAGVGMFGDGGGGGAGGFGAVVTGNGSGSINMNVTGGHGGAGGSIPSTTWGWAGDGGSGGTGLHATSGANVTNWATIRGGDGGNGQDGVFNTSHGGSGGAGGAGFVGSGGIFVNHGTVAGGNGGSAGSGWAPGTTGSGGAGITGSNLVVINSGTISGALSGDGTTRAAAIRFTGGANTLTFGNASSGLTGGIVIEAGTLTFAQQTDVAVDNVVSGAGAVIKTGSGTLTLTGSNTYTGGTTVSGGKLVVNGSIVGTVTLNGGSLGGSGSIGTVSVGSGGTIAPGNSIGTLTVTGNISFAAGSTYQVEVNAAGQSDRIVVSGTATLSGGTVEVLAENGNYAASTSYTILTATGGVTGQFSTVTSNLAFLTPSLSYGGSSVTLTMTRNDTSFGPGDGGATSTSQNYVAATRNQGFVAIAAEALGVGNPVYDALLSGTAAEARAGFELLSGEAHAQAVSVRIGESALVREAILSRLRGPLLTMPGGQVAASFSADLPSRKGGTAIAAPRFAPRYVLWGEAIGGAGNTSGDGNAAALSRRSGGAILGADLKLYDTGASSLRIGVAGGYTQSRFDLDARLSTGKLESGHAALYAGARFGQLRFDAGLAYSWGESDIRRQVAIRGFGDLLRSQRPGSVTQGFAELGYAFAFQGFALEPFAQLALLRVSSEATTEQGGAAALRLFSSEQNLGFSTLGLRAEAQLLATPFFARAMLGWRHGFGDLTPQALTAFASGTTPARVFAAQIDRNALTAEAGLDWRASPSTTLGLTYAATLGERSRDHALKGRVEVRF